VAAGRSRLLRDALLLALSAVWSTAGRTESAGAQAAVITPSKRSGRRPEQRWPSTSVGVTPVGQSHPGTDQPTLSAGALDMTAVWCSVARTAGQIAAAARQPPQRPTSTCSRKFASNLTYVHSVASSTASCTRGGEAEDRVRAAVRVFVPTALRASGIVQKPSSTILRAGRARPVGHRTRTLLLGPDHQAA